MSGGRRHLYRLLSAHESDEDEEELADSEEHLRRLHRLDTDDDLEGMDMMMTDSQKDRKSDDDGRDELHGVSVDVRGLATHGEISELTVVAEGEERTTWFVWLLVMCCSISGLLFGAFGNTASGCQQ